MTALDSAFRSRPLRKQGDRLTVRLAMPADGEMIAGLVQTDWRADIDWSQVGANWLVCEIEGAVVGCLQVLPGKPFGHCEFLGLHRELKRQMKARVVRLLLQQGIAVLKLYGCLAVTGIIPREMESYCDAVVRRGCSVIGEGAIVVRRLK